jgi:hypothetical protein
VSETKPTGGPGAWPAPPETTKDEPQDNAELRPAEHSPASTPEASSWSPKPKVAAAATTVPFSGLVLWAVEQFGVEMPVYVAGDVAILLAVLVAYLVPER